MSDSKTIRMSRKSNSPVNSELPKSPRLSLPIKRISLNSVTGSRNTLVCSTVKLQELVPRPNEPFKPLPGRRKSSKTVLLVSTDPAVYTTPSTPLKTGVDVYIHEMS